MNLSDIERQQLACAVRDAELSGKRSDTSWWLLTGAPGSGKSSLADLFKQHGWPVMTDPGRAEFEAQARLGVPARIVRQKYAHFQQLVLARSLAALEQVAPEERRVFDYGVAEALAFLKIAGLPWQEAFVSAAACLHFEKVFVLDLVPLVSTDPIRAESDATRLSLRDLIEDVYRSLGHSPIRVPLLSIDARYKWIIAANNEQSA